MAGSYHYVCFPVKTMYEFVKYKHCMQMQNVLLNWAESATDITHSINWELKSEFLLSTKWRKTWLKIQNDIAATSDPESSVSNVSCASGMKTVCSDSVTTAEAWETTWIALSQLFSLMHRVANNGAFMHWFPAEINYCPFVHQLFQMHCGFNAKRALATWGQWSEWK